MLRGSVYNSLLIIKLEQMPKQMRNFKTGSVEAHPISLKLPPRCQKFFVLGFEMTDLIFLENEIIQVRPT